MSDVNPLYADGPLKGRDFAIPASSIRSGVVVVDDDGSYLHYCFHRFALLGRIIWIGAIGPKDALSESDLFDLIVSDRAKQASEVMQDVTLTS